MDLSQRDDLRDVYMHTFNNFATDPTQVVEAVPGVTNTRYARELLGVLVTHGLVAVDQNQDHVDVWQTLKPGTYDDHSVADAESVIDEFLSKFISDTDQENTDMTDTATPTPTSAKPEAPAKNGNPADLPLCRCGCKSPIGRKSTYKPGHDARHAGDVARALAGTKDPQAGEIMLASLGSDALRQKATAMADRITAKTDAKIAKQAEKKATPAKSTPQAATPADFDPDPQVEDDDNTVPVEPTPQPVVVASNTGTVKFGRWTYPVKRDEHGQVVRNTNKDGKGDNFVPVTEQDMHKVVWTA